MYKPVHLLTIVLYVCCLSTSKVLSLVDSDGCGEVKGCFHYPDDCETPDCDILITWQGADEGDATEFGLMGKLTTAEHYVGIGFSHNEKMPDTDVWACLQLLNSSIVLDHSYNPEHSNVQYNTTGAGNLAASLDSGTLECTFTRLNTNDDAEHFFDLTASEYYLFIPRGPRDDSQGPPKLDKHIDIPIVSSTMINFTEYSSASGHTTTDTSQKMHGSLMLFGWIGCASIAIIMARYFKPMWPGSALLGQKVWFTFHRTLMLINVACFSTAFVVIFVYVGGWVDYEHTSDTKFVHATIGCITVGLGLTNPVLALFRPNPTGKNRWMFNWAHFAVGMSAHLLSMINVYLGMTILLLPSYVRWIFVGWACFHFAVEICLEILNCVKRESDKFTSYKIYSILTNSSSSLKKSSSTERIADMMEENIQASSFRLCMLVTYSVITVGVVIYLIVKVCLM